MRVEIEWVMVARMVDKELRAWLEICNSGQKEAN